MFSKSKKMAVLIATSAFLATSFGGNIVFADSNTNSNNTTITNNTSTADNNPSVMIASQSNYKNIDVAAVKKAMLTELNRLRIQNGLSSLTSVDVLNNYAQTRTDSFINTGSVDDHANWNTSLMYPYNFTAEENIAQMPYYMINSTDPSIIAEKITNEFYSELYNKVPDYGHRKNMLNPYINYVGIGLSISDNGMIYFSQEMGNNQASYSKYDPNDLNNYYQTRYNDYANPSKYDIADANKKGDDYVNRNNYTTADMRGGVTTKNYVTPLYDRYGNKSGLEISPNSDWISDVVATINGNNYYHVSNNGFVSAGDVLPWAKFLYGSSITATADAKIYDNNGNFTGQTVNFGSKWIIDRRAVNPITNIKMYRIGTNSWLQDNQTKLN